ncbi:hypothetical protein [Desulfofustis limnaeus]|nr:hypothetical protein [Desulfofustis limnaeus]MDX9896462.1 hypothetical protein [Desulfofustis sp.]
MTEHTGIEFPMIPAVPAVLPTKQAIFGQARLDLPSRRPVSGR